MIRFSFQVVWSYFRIGEKSELSERRLLDSAGSLSGYSCLIKITVEEDKSYSVIIEFFRYGIKKNVRGIFHWIRGSENPQW